MLVLSHVLLPSRTARGVANMERCYFAKEVPQIEVRGELVFVICEEAKCEVAFTPFTMRSFIAAANEALAKWQVAQLRDSVVRFPGHH